MANPTLLKTPIASGGDKNTIPETTGSTTGLLSQEKGWQQINSLPINAGGIAPSRLDFNGVFNLLSSILFYTQKGWQWEFDETQDYFAGCTVKDTADGKTYVCIADVNASATHPSSDTAHWKLSDLATKDDLANYLPLSGGSMTGRIVNRSVDDDLLIFFGGKGEDETGYGANFQLYGPTHPTLAGAFRLYAGSQGVNKLLEGKTDGTLKWAGANVLTDAQGGYLPLSGGTVTGTISSANNGTLLLTGGIGSDIASFVQLDGKQTPSPAGPRAILSATSDTDNKQYVLTILPRNGELLFGEFGVQPNDLGGSAIVAKSLGITGYIKFASGLIEQWGQTSNVARWDFPITFPNAVIGVYAGINCNDEQYGYNAVKTLTTSYLEPTSRSPLVTTYWRVLGY